MKNNINEAGVIFHNVGGHNHDGVNSSKVDFSNYSDAELAGIIDRVRGDDLLPSGGTGGGGGGSSSTASGLDSIYFHMPGTIGLSPSVVAKKVFIYPVGTINIYVTLGTAGVGPSVVTFYKNEDVIGSISIPASQGEIFPVTGSIPAAFNGTTDYVKARVTTAGSGAYELGVLVVGIPA